MDEQPQQSVVENQPAPVPPPPDVISAIVPPAKKGPGLMWLLIILFVSVIGVGAYIFYSLQPKAEEKTSVSAPGLMTQESKPGAGFGTQDSTATATPTITSSDSVSDIGKDFSGTTLDAGSTTEFDADLQSL